MSRQTAELPLDLPTAAEAPAHLAAPASAHPRHWKSFAWPFLIPAAALIAIAIHFLLPNRGLFPTSHSYPTVLLTILSLSILLPLIPNLRPWLRHRSRIL